MPRTARKRGESCIYHIVVQSAKKKKVFADPEAKRFYIDRLSQYETQFGLKVYAYCLLDSHAHILVEEGEIGISDLMRRLNVSFACWYRRHVVEGGGTRNDSIFRGRYLSEPLPKALVPGTIRYIELEPWRNAVTDWEELYPYATHQTLPENRAFSDEVSEEDEPYASLPFLYLDESVSQYGKTEEEGVAALKARLGSVEKVKNLKREEKINLIHALRFSDHLSINLICRVTGFGRGFVMRVKK